jgi:hypothetical protein
MSPENCGVFSASEKGDIFEEFWYFTTRGEGELWYQS